MKTLSACSPAECEVAHHELTCAGCADCENVTCSHEPTRVAHTVITLADGREFEVPNDQVLVWHYTICSRAHRRAYYNVQTGHVESVEGSMRIDGVRIEYRRT